MWSAWSVTGQDLHGGEGRLPASLVVERRDPHEPVGALLDRQGPVRVGRLDRERRGLDPRLLRVGDVVHLIGQVVALAVAGVHAQQHLGPVGGVHPAGLRADGDQRLAHVELAGQERADLELGHSPLEVAELLLRLSQGVRVALALGQLDEDRQVVEALAQGRDLAQLALDEGQPGRHLLCGRRVVPEVRRRGLRLELDDLRAHRREVQDLLDAGEGGLELGHGRGEVKCHEAQAYRRAHPP